MFFLKESSILGQRKGTWGASSCEGDSVASREKENKETPTIWDSHSESGRSHPELTKGSYSPPTKEKAIRSYLGFIVRKN